MATYGGSAIFGAAVRILPSMAGIRVKRSGFFGLEGIFQIYGGGAGGTITVDGILYSATPDGVDTLLTTFQSYADGVARTLVDTTGTSWPNVVLDTVIPTGQRYVNGITGNYELPYKATFTVLV